MSASIHIDEPPEVVIKDDVVSVTAISNGEVVRWCLSLPSFRMALAHATAVLALYDHPASNVERIKRR